METMSRRVDIPRVRAAIDHVARELRSDPDGAVHVSVLEGLLAELAALETRAHEHAGIEERLRKSHAALMQLGRGALEEALREMTETATEILDVARTSVWLYNADQTAIQCLELFLRRERAHESGVELFRADYPSYFDALAEERSIAAHDAHTDPRTACFSESYLTPLGINAMLDAPIRVGGRMIGVVCNEHIGPARTWTAEEEQFAASIADFVALAIETGRRRESEEQLRAMVEALESER